MWKYRRITTWIQDWRKSSHGLSGGCSLKSAWKPFKSTSINSKVTCMNQPNESNWTSLKIKPQKSWFQVSTQKVPPHLHNQTATAKASGGTCACPRGIPMSLSFGPPPGNSAASRWGSPGAVGGGPGGPDFGFFSQRKMMVFMGFRWLSSMKKLDFWWDVWNLSMKHGKIMGWWGIWVKYGLVVVPNMCSCSHNYRLSFLHVVLCWYRYVFHFCSH